MMATEVPASPASAWPTRSQAKSSSS